jgi:PPM family protein phosphatase
VVKINDIGRTDVGRVRKINEDALILKPELAFWAVADGMGGEEKGEVASRIFTETAAELFSHASGRSEEETTERVQRAFALANERILSWAKANQVQKMGCTAELIAFFDSDYVVGHVGDSRTYCFRQRNLRQLTRDHSLVQAQLDQGILSPAEAQRSPLRNIILRAVGTEETLAVDLLRGKMLPGDIYLLCSDGLTGMVDDRTIQDTLSLPLELPQKADRLIEQAKLAGGDDNITVILCEVLGSGPEKPF